ADGKLRRVDLAGGQPKVLADAPRLTGGAWSPRGEIVFSPNYGSGVQRVSADGGPVTALYAPDSAKGESGLRAGAGLPGGRRFVCRVERWGKPTQYVVGDIAGGATHPLLDDADFAMFAAPHWLLFVRGGSLFARRFDPASLALTGDAIPLATGAPADQNF